MNLYICLTIPPNTTIDQSHFIYMHNKGTQPTSGNKMSFHSKVSTINRHQNALELSKEIPSVIFAIAIGIYSIDFYTCSSSIFCFTLDWCGFAYWIPFHSLHRSICHDRRVDVWLGWLVWLVDEGDTMMIVHFSIHIYLHYIQFVSISIVNKYTVPRFDIPFEMSHLINAKSSKNLKWIKASRLLCIQSSRWPFSWLDFFTQKGKQQTANQNKKSVGKEASDRARAARARSFVLSQWDFAVNCPEHTTAAQPSLWYGKRCSWEMCRRHKID